MTLQAVLAPLFVLIALTFALGLWAFFLRLGAIRRREVHARDIALREPNWPPRVAQVSNAFQNQFELPLLFYVLTILAWITKQADLLFVLLAWVFVALRVLHAYVHVTSNHLGRRAGLFVAGAIVLAVMWAIFTLRILLA
jgi:hypothetical protein